MLARRRAAAHACACLLLTAAVSACGGGHDGARATTHAAPRESTSCAERLPLDTLLDNATGRQPRPLILALHGARQGGYGMQRYTGLSDDAKDFLVAYPTTPHDNGFWQVDDVPQLLALIDAIDRCVPVTTVTAIGFSNGGLMANALACHAADRVRAIVLVASGYEGLGQCSPPRRSPSNATVAGRRRRGPGSRWRSGTRRGRRRCVGSPRAARRLTALGRRRLPTSGLPSQRPARGRRPAMGRPLRGRRPPPGWRRAMWVRWVMDAHSRRWR